MATVFHGSLLPTFKIVIFDVFSLWKAFLGGQLVMWWEGLQARHFTHRDKLDLAPVKSDHW
jgi:hypothetical protein